MRRCIILLFIVLVIACQLALPAPSHAEPETHYWFARPIPKTGNSTADRGFPYGWTRSGASPIHHGVDIPNRLNTPVIAAANGTVYYAGSDADHIFGPYGNFYGNVVVIQHDIAAPEGGTLYTLYGHLNVVNVSAGEHVMQGQQIGGVGKTGIALWYHLHFEVRVGNPDDYNAVRNPELWYAPRKGSGTLIGRMVDSNGNLAMGIRFTLGTLSSIYPGWTYADPSMRSDPGYNENFTVGDLPAGCWTMRVRNGKGGYAFSKRFCIKSGETIFLDAQLDSSM
jgi:hypothetical protein